MDIFDFITQQQIEELPENPQAAFTQFVQHAGHGLDKAYQSADGSDDDSRWQIYHEAKLQFQNFVTAAARTYGIEPFASMDVPSLRDYSDDDYRQFRSDLNHYITQILLGSSTKDSVALSDKSKDKIRQYMYNLREAIEQSKLPEDKRDALLKKLESFESELNRRRLNLVEVSKVAFALFAAPGAAWASVDIVQKLTTNIMQIVAEEKAREEEVKPITTNVIGVLAAPRKKVTHTPNLDDEIPF